MKKIKNILFDLGGVIINLDMPATLNGFKNAMGDEFPKWKAVFEEADIFNQYEKGNISTAVFAQHFIDTGLFTADTVRQIWNSILRTAPKNRLDFLKVLAKDYNLYLLSNTNAMHIEQAEADLQTMYGITDFRGEFFTKGYYSFEIGMIKPDAEIYEFVLKDSGLLAAETLFIDDNEANIKSAAAVGLQTIWHEHNAEIEPVLTQYLGL